MLSGDLEFAQKSFYELIDNGKRTKEVFSNLTFRETLKQPTLLRNLVKLLFLDNFNNLVNYKTWRTNLYAF